MRGLRQSRPEVQLLSDIADDVESYARAVLPGGWGVAAIAAVVLIWNGAGWMGLPAENISPWARRHRALTGALLAWFGTHIYLKGVLANRNGRVGRVARYI